MRSAPIAALVALAVVLPVAGSSAASSCGTLNGGFENTIRATNVSCATAKSVVRRWHHKAVTQQQGPGTKYAGSYYCASHPTDIEHVKVACANGHRHITFFAGP